MFVCVCSVVCVTAGWMLVLLIYLSVAYVSISCLSVCLRPSLTETHAYTQTHANSHSYSHAHSVSLLTLLLLLLSLSFYFSYLSIFLCMFIYLAVNLSIHLSLYVQLSDDKFIYTSFYICTSIRQSIYLFIYLRPGSVLRGYTWAINIFIISTQWVPLSSKKREEIQEKGEESNKIKRKKEKRRD